MDDGYWNKYKYAFKAGAGALSAISTATVGLLDLGYTSGSAAAGSVAPLVQDLIGCVPAGSMFPPLQIAAALAYGTNAAKGMGEAFLADSNFTLKIDPGYWSKYEKCLNFANELDPKTKFAIKAGVGAVVAVSAVTVALPVIGFTSGGVAAGSVAASVQSSIGCVSAGSTFAALQSAGAAGLAGGTKVAIGMGGAAAVGLYEKKDLIF